MSLTALEISTQAALFEHFMQGVAVSKLGGDIFILHLAFDGIGYALHGIGLLPWVVDIEKLADK